MLSTRVQLVQSLQPSSPKPGFLPKNEPHRLHAIDAASGTILNYELIIYTRARRQCPSSWSNSFASSQSVFSNQNRARTGSFDKPYRPLANALPSKS